MNNISYISKTKRLFHVNRWGNIDVVASETSESSWCGQKQNVVNGCMCYLLIETIYSFAFVMAATSFSFCFKNSKALWSTQFSLGAQKIISAQNSNEYAYFLTSRFVKYLFQLLCQHQVASHFDLARHVSAHASQAEGIVSQTLDTCYGVFNAHLPAGDKVDEVTVINGNANGTCSGSFGFFLGHFSIHGYDWLDLITCISKKNNYEIRGKLWGSWVSQDRQTNLGRANT